MQFTREQGIEHIEIKFLTDLYILSGTVDLKFSLEDFMSVVNEAKQTLISAYN